MSNYEVTFAQSLGTSLNRGSTEIVNYVMKINKKLHSIVIICQNIVNVIFYGL